MIGDVGAALELLGIAVIFVLAVIGGAAVVVHAYLSVNRYHGRHVRDDGVAVFKNRPADPGIVWHSACRCVLAPVVSDPNELVGFNLDTGAPVYRRDLAAVPLDKIVTSAGDYGLSIGGIEVRP